MKKWFDKFIAQSSRGQVCALAVAFAVLAIAGGIIGQFVLKKNHPDSAKFGFRGTWGLMQCVDGGFVDATISSNTDIKDEKIVGNAPILVVVLSLGFWLGGMVLISFFTGAATNFLDVRREKILTGNVNYSFRKKYILIIGYDFQIGNLIRNLFKEKPASALSIVLVTDSDVERIYDDLLPELQPSEAHRLFIMRKDISLNSSYDKFWITGAEEIYVIGDGDAIGRDGKTLQAFDALSLKAASEVNPVAQSTQEKKDKKIKAYLHIEDFILYSNVRAIKLSMDDLGIFDVNVFNYYESWAWECWSNRDSTDGKDDYLPIRYEKGTERAELFVIGASRMGLAMVNFAMPLMNYGGNGKHCRITIFDPDGSKQGLLPDRKTLDALPELDVVFRPMDGCSEEANAIMLEAADRKDTSVTVVIAISNPAAALRAYAGFSKLLCRKDISVLIWQATDSESIPDKKYLQMGGSGTTADKRIVRYFGMTDRLPWKNSPRYDYGMAVDYYYSCWFPWGKENPVSPGAPALDFVEKARAIWNEAWAKDGWSKTDRWKKWSSVNSGDTFREKSVLFQGVEYETAAERILKAEHNRWWTEKILAGWQPSEQKSADGKSHADKKNMIHGDMIPFEELPDEVKDKDKINIAAMAAFGFLKQTT